MEKDPLDFLEIEEASEDNIYTWKVVMMGPPNSPYSGGKWTLQLNFPGQYPFKPPSILFLTRVFHPSVSKHGEICAALIGDNWGPTLNVRHCMTTIYGILASPSADHPLEEEIGALLREKPKDFEKQARKYTKKYAMT